MINLTLRAVDAYFAVFYELIEVFIVGDYSHKYIFIFTKFNRTCNNVIGLVALATKAVKPHFFYHIYANWKLLF